MENPVRRIRGRLGLSQEKLAEKIGIHWQALYLTECGCYSRVLPAILHYLVGEGYDAEEINQEYSEFIHRKRAALREKYSFSDLEWGDFNTSIHPFKSFRETLRFSRMAFAKAFCVESAFLYKLERGETVSLSGQVKEALLAVGFTREFIEELNSRCEDFAYSGLPSEAKPG